MKRKDVFWGLILICCAIMILFNQFGYFVGINPVKIIFTGFLLLIVARNLPRLQFFGILFPIAIICIMYKHNFHMSHVSNWAILLTALFGSAGLTLLFKPRKHPQLEGPSANYSDIEGDSVRASCSFGGDTNYVHSQCLSRGDFSCSFGSLEVYLDQAILAPDGADIHIDCSFGAVELYIPKEWNVVDNLTALLGAVERRPSSPAPGAPTLYLNGNVMLGAIEIHII